MNLLTFLAILFYASTIVAAAPFTGWLFGGKQQNNDVTTTRPALLEKVQQFRDQVYERKREFLNGVNEKVSNLLWIPPLYTTTEVATTSEQPHIFYQDPPTEKESDELMNVEMYARSSFLSPDDLDDVIPPPENNKPTVTYNIKESFNILGRIWY